MRVLVRQPDATADELIEQIDTQASRVLVNSIRSEFRTALRLLDELGHLKGVTMN